MQKKDRGHVPTFTNLLVQRHVYFVHIYLCSIWHSSSYSSTYLIFLTVLQSFPYWGLATAAAMAKQRIRLRVFILMWLCEVECVLGATKCLNVCCCRACQPFYSKLSTCFWAGAPRVKRTCCFSPIHLRKTRPLLHVHFLPPLHPTHAAQQRSSSYPTLQREAKMSCTNGLFTKYVHI